MFSLMLALLKWFKMLRFSTHCVTMLCKRDKIFIFKDVFVLYQTCFESLWGSSLCINLGFSWRSGFKFSLETSFLVVELSIVRHLWKPERLPLLLCFCGFHYVTPKVSYPLGKPRYVRWLSGPSGLLSFLISVWGFWVTGIKNHTFKTDNILWLLLHVNVSVWFKTRGGKVGNDWSLGTTKEAQC